ncbi:MAG: adenosine kinase [Gammaproteobacteria bacterium]|jgi:sugar/nucleoside kinase (ribokinase family)|nr:adenosine kinase [Gammaproteobacteria bacterium]
MYDVYGLGNALVDMEFRVDDGFLTSHGIAKGHMTLVDEERLNALVAALADHEPERMSGGSAANTMIAVQGFGGKTFYSCRLADDEVGGYFLNDLRNAGIVTNDNAATPATSGQSGQCLVLVTPDAERSMNSFLGISTQLCPDEIDEQALRQSRYFYAEGYLSSGPDSLAAAIACRERAEAAGVKTAISLSDPSMVEIFRDNLVKILGNGVDHLFCNEEEALTWAGTDRLDIAVTELKDVGKALNVTLGKQGSLAVTPHDQTMVPGYEVKAVDTNGAGDMYAGACLYGWCAGMDPDQAAAFGNFAAARLVQTYGARMRHVGDYAKALAAFKAERAAAG